MLLCIALKIYIALVYLLGTLIADGIFNSFFCYIMHTHTHICIYIYIYIYVKQINSIFDLSFYYYLVLYNTTGVLHSSDKMTICECTLAG